MGYDLFDINSAFYQDTCVPFKSPYGTDVLLNDRIAYYYHNNELICQSNCKPTNYSIESQYLKCDCDTSNSQIITREIDKLTPKAIHQSFKDTLKFSNYRVLLCYKLPFRINSLTTNIGSILIIILFIIYLILLIIFCFKGINEFKSYFNNENNDNNDIKPTKPINEKFNTHIIKRNILNNNELNTHKSSSRKSLNKNIKNMNLFQFPPKKKLISFQQESFKNENSTKKTRNIHQKKFSDNDTKEKQILSIKQNSENIDSMQKLEEKQINLEDIKKEENIEIYNFESKEKQTIQEDKNKFFEIYWPISRKKHIILFTFFNRNDHNIIYIKYERFIFSVCTYMALNIFFFSDKSMHKIYLDYGKYNFLQQIPQIIYSTIVSQLIDIIALYLISTDKYFYEIKKLKMNSVNKINDIIKCIKIKITSFFIFSFLILIFYWYAVACFCSVYENTQIIFIKDSITSFAIGLLYPFILYIFLAVYKLITSKKNKKIDNCV